MPLKKERALCYLLERDDVDLQDILLLLIHLTNNFLGKFSIQVALNRSSQGKLPRPGKQGLNQPVKTTK